MKKLFSILSFIVLLILIIELRLQFVDLSTSSTAFVFMLLITVLTSLFWGFIAGVVMLIINAVITGYVFMTPYNFALLSNSEVRQLGLFLLEGMVLLLLIYILKKSKEQEHELREKFQVILASIGDAVVATDKEGKITYMNASAQKLFQWKFHDAQMKHIFSLFHIEGNTVKKTFKQEVQSTIEGGNEMIVNKPMKIKNRRGTLIDIQDTIAPLRDIKGNTIGAVIICKDVSEHREMEEQKEVLLGAISHELKNYITSIHGYSQLILKKAKESKQEGLVSFAEKLGNKVETMKHMVISMLDLSKLSMGKLDMTLEHFDIEDLIQSTINDLEISTKHMIKMKGALDVYVEADRIRIGQVLTNLISNAIKYSPEDKEIHVGVTRKDMDVIISVTDFGQGIPEEKVEKIFDPFYRAVTSTEKKNITGSGLGLYISKEIVKQNGGSIWVETKDGEGATFFFSLPAVITDDTVIQKKSLPFISYFKKLFKRKG